MSIEERKRHREIKDLSQKQGENNEKQNVQQQHQEQMLQQIIDQKNSLQQQLDTFSLKHQKLITKIEGFIPKNDKEEEPEEVSELKLVIQDNEQTVNRLNDELKKLEAIAAQIEESFAVQNEQVVTATRTVSKNNVDLDKSCFIS